MFFLYGIHVATKIFCLNKQIEKIVRLLEDFFSALLFRVALCVWITASGSAQREACV